MKIYQPILLATLPLIFSDSVAQAVSLNFNGVTASGQPDDLDEMGNPVGMKFAKVANAPGVGFLDLVVVSTSTYDPANRSNNKVSGNFGQINLLTNTNTDFEFRLVKNSDGTDVVPDELIITFLDLDGSQGTPQGAPYESITVSTPATYRAGSAINVTPNPSGQVNFSGTFNAGAGNNPDSLSLTSEQSSIAFDLEFLNTGKFNFNFDAGAGTSGRNILFAGEVIFDPEEQLQTGIIHVPEPLTIIGSFTALGFGALFRRELAKKKNSKQDS